MGRRIDKASATSRIADWLKDGKTITPVQANDMFANRRLAAIIHLLINKRGMDIINLNEGRHVEAVYSIRPKADQAQAA